MKTPIALVSVLTLVLGLCILSPANAQNLDGRKLTIEGADQASVNVPVSLPFDGKAPDATVVVVDTKSKKEFPASIRDNALVFVVDSLPAKGKMECEAKVLKEKKAPKVAITKKGDAPILEIVVGGGQFTAYNYSNENRKPFLWPVYCEGNVTVTRDWPMDQNAPEKQTGKKDHIHHKSIWTSYGDVNGVDCWGEEGDKAGYQNSDDVAFGSGDAYGWVHAKNTWQDGAHKPVLAEEREYRFYDSPASARIFDETVTFTAAYGKVLFKDTKEGGIIAFRIRPEIQGDKGGTIMNASGAKGEAQCWGKPSPWCDYFGNIEGVGVRGIALFDNPANLRHPCCWHVRNYGLNGSSCFGLGAFTKGQQNGDYELAEGKSLTFHYRAVIHSGDDKQAKIADLYADYATPPKASWAK